MKAAKTCAGSVGSTAGKILITLAFTSMIGGLFTGPAFAQNNGWNRGQQQRGWHERDRRNDRYRYDSRRRVYRPIYAPPLYAPPPVIYAPSPSPGVSIFFPLFR